MTMNTPESPEPGFKVTIKDVWSDVQELKRIVAERLPEDGQARLRKLEIQVGSQWVVIGIVIVGLGAAVVKAFTA